MKFSTFCGLVFVITFFSCGQKTSSKHINEKIEQKTLTLKSGLLISNGINRGAGYQDSLGIFHNLRYIPVRIKNDSTFSVILNLKFLKEYKHPFTDGNQFNVVPMKSEWVVDGAEISDKMLLDLQEDMKNPQMTKSLKPGEEFLFGIGTRYQVVGEDYAAPLPQALYVQADVDNNKLCEDALYADRTELNIDLRLKLIFNQGNEIEYCRIISCGKISYKK